MPGQLTMTVKGVTIGPLEIGWHLKGAWGSWQNIDAKPGVKIRVDAFVKDQTIFGVKKLILNNMHQEGSAMNQQLTMRLFRAMKVPASRTGYSHLTINNIDYGLYTNIESLDRVSLARWYPTTKHLYKSGDDGLPISHAPGNSSDIKLHLSNLLRLYEVTLIKGAAQLKQK